MTTALVFAQAPLTAPPVRLVFGEVGEPVEVEVVVAGAFAAFGGTVRITTVAHATIAGVFPPFGGEVLAQYRSGTDRPLVGRLQAAWQRGQPRLAGTEESQQVPVHLRVGTASPSRSAVALQAQIRLPLAEALVALHARRRAVHQDAMRLAAGAVFSHDDAQRDRRVSRTLRFDTARPAGASLASDWHERLRDPRGRLTSGWQTGAPRDLQRSATMAVALPRSRGWSALFDTAIVPPPGQSSRPGPVVPPADPCYRPDPHLLFSAPRPAATGLVFVCERHAGPPAVVVVPLRRTYIVINETSLRRVDGDVALPAPSLSLNLDADSWTWGFSASLPASALPLLEPDEDGAPVELEARINGQPFRLLAERLSRERQFGQAGIRVQGRGRAALLDAPYAAVRSFGNASQPRTAQQLAADVLTVNGVGLGWDLDWGLADWLVPAGVFSHQGTFISALGQIATAAGGYLQPHATDPALRVLPRYPVPSWQWGTAVPDLELPSAVTTRESIEWLDKPRYNRVFVSGTGQGVLGQITRQGTAGDLVAPMVTDALATHANAVRQRGIAVLSDTGRQAHVTLRLPVLPETGVIVPGKFVRYVDGTTARVGLVRSTSVDVGLPEVWQTIGVETRA